MRSPSVERFQPASDLVSPWRDSGCPRVKATRALPGCYTVDEAALKTTPRMTIYERNGAIWHAFDLNAERAQFNSTDLAKGFLPFSAAIRYPVYSVVLRMVAESQNWYEVEVNERTRDTKFIAKNDPVWTRSTWDHWLTSYGDLYLGDDQRQLLDEPEGRPIEGCLANEFYKVSFLKRTGDWAYVEDRYAGTGSKMMTCSGWIKWRETRDLLVGTYLNGYKIPGDPTREPNLGADRVVRPAYEKFRSTENLVGPWRNNSCRKALPERECQLASVMEMGNSYYMTIFDHDGRVWYGQDLGPYSGGGPDVTDTEKGLLPFQSNGGELLFRIVAESDHWYKIEINEKTLETRYILKNDPFWVRSKWEYRISKFSGIVTRAGQVILLDKPAGEPIEDGELIPHTNFDVEKAEEEWVYVRTRFNGKDYFGWIRWRDGRRLLVGCAYNDFKPPAADSELASR